MNEDFQSILISYCVCIDRVPWKQWNGFVTNLPHFSHEFKPVLGDRPVTVRAGGISIVLAGSGDRVLEVLKTRNDHGKGSLPLTVSRSAGVHI
jgi:hypothetical protein